MKNLTWLMSLAGTTGTISLFAVSGFLKFENLLAIVFPTIVGPSVILAASMLEGTLKEKLLVALTAGLISTLVVMVCAALGTLITDNLNMSLLKIFGGISILSISLMMLNIKLPSSSPIIIIMLGFAISLLWK
ncbi:hypothetical protein C0585_03690 [Candidatus Woesearchaeota archaeon]|nr:MAG: hypothetical protein C0585_03690 [Candidatus Woesearchaeota archaeon]